MVYFTEKHTINQYNWVIGGGEGGIQLKNLSTQILKILQKSYKTFHSRIKTKSIIDLKNAGV